jgi:phosphoribosyl 1,2-cyclic phosphodiesterase
MTFRFRILGSSSKGNAALLTTENSKILIDAGFSARRLEALLQESGESLSNIDAIFLTHEHSDHSTGLTGLSKWPNIKIFANRETARAAQDKLNWRAPWNIFETGSTFQFRDLEINSFPIPHDASDPVGYIISAGDNTPEKPKRSLAWVTDLGYAPELIKQKIASVEILVIESNYDETMLENSSRAFYLKQRIKGRHGHLGNDATHELLKSIVNPAWKQVYLAHLSEECNCVNIVKDTFSSLMNNGGNFKIDIVNPCNGMMAACEI